MEKHYLKLLMVIVLFLFATNEGFSQETQNPSIEWQKCIGGSNDDYATSIIQTSDGGYITVGTATSNDFDLIESIFKKYSDTGPRYSPEHQKYVDNS